MNSDLLSRSLLRFYVIISILSSLGITSGASLSSYDLTNLTRLARQANNQCENGFKCTTIEECIDAEKRCDGTVDCKDGSDEFNDCKEFVDCPGYLFTCDYGACIDADKKCNGRKDCRDNSDEANCVDTGKSDKISSNCKSDQFECKSGQCISVDDKCNGVTDCEDKSDETKDTCLNMYCPGFTFKCDYGACVDGDAKCNKVKNCIDNSDEEDCPPDVTPVPVPVKNVTEAPPIIVTEGCELPEHPDFGQWSILSGQGNPKQKVAVNTVLEFGCNVGYKLSAESKYVVCKQTGWSVGEMPTCVKKCSPLYSTEVTKIQCHDNRNIEIKCDEATDGTSASFTCAPYYESPDRNINSKKVTRYCWSGSWNLPPPVCQPVCGEKKVSAEPLIVNGQKVEKGDYPWVTAIYQRVGSQFTNVCGGSVLTQRVILTAAHCVTDTYGHQLPIDSIQVAVGKYYNKYKDPRDTQAQYSKIERILTPSSYKGDSQRYASDIALLVTESVLLLSKVVQPVCFQDLPNIYLDTGLTGVITGWGFTLADRTPSDELREISVPFKPDSVCQQELPSDWADKYYTFDKMCAGHYNKSIAVCKGDSGGGLVFNNPKDKRFYVHGIVSVGHGETSGCNVQVSALYTKVASHYDWVEKIISQYLRV